MGDKPFFEGRARDSIHWFQVVPVQYYLSAGGVSDLEPLAHMTRMFADY
jgi:hypothetical protein